MNPYTVYRCYDASDDLLYVGCTSHMRQRIDVHIAKSPWWADVARITEDKVKGRQLALDLEAGAILRHRPRYNLQHNHNRVGVA